MAIKLRVYAVCFQYISDVSLDSETNAIKNLYTRYVEVKHYISKDLQLSEWDEKKITNLWLLVDNSKQRVQDVKYKQVDICLKKGTHKLSNRIREYQDFRNKNESLTQYPLAKLSDHLVIILDSTNPERRNLLHKLRVWYNEYDKKNPDLSLEVIIMLLTFNEKVTKFEAQHQSKYKPLNPYEPSANSDAGKVSLAAFKWMKDNLNVSSPYYKIYNLQKQDDRYVDVITRLEKYKEAISFDATKKSHNVNTKISYSAEKINEDITDFIGKLRSKHITNKSIQEFEPHEYQLQIQNDKSNDSKFTQAVAKEIQVYNHELKKAKQDKKQKLDLQQLEIKDLPPLKEKVQDKIKHYKELEKYLRDGINAQLYVSVEKTSAHTFAANGMVHNYSVEEVLEAATDHAEWGLICSNLKLRGLIIDFEQLRQECIDLMIFSTENNYLEEVSKSIEKIEKIKDQSERKEEETALISLLKIDRQYKIYKPEESALEKNVLYLYFEYVSKLRMRPEVIDGAKSQFQLISDIIAAIDSGETDPSRLGLVFQMMMGGGKTSVIMSYIINYIAKKTKNLPAFICHHSQFETASKTLDELQRNRFKKTIIRINPTQAELKDVKSLNKILELLNEAKTMNTGIVLPNTALHYIELEYITKCMEVSSKCNDAKIEALSEILKFFRGNTIGLFDESHLNLKITDIVNIPTDDPEVVSAEKVDIVGDIYTAFAKCGMEKIPVNKNQQNKSMVDKVYRAEVIKEIAAELYEKYKDKEFIKLDSDENILLITKTDFVDYVTNAEYNQKYVHNLEEIYSRYNQVAARIATIRYVLQYILPQTLSQSTDEHYGFNINATDSKEKLLEVVPYQSVRVPTPQGTKFGNEFESLGCMYQTWLSCEIKEQWIRDFAAAMDENALNELSGQVTGAYEDTKANKLFYQVTQHNIKDCLYNLKKIEDAVKYVKDNPESRLTLAKEFSAKLITCNNVVVSSNNINLGNGLHGAFACSGTPSNLETYHKKIRQENPLLEVGSNGKIMYKMLEDSLEKKLSVSIAEPSKCMESTFNILEQKIKSKNSPVTNTLIDAGAFFKDISNERLAERILTVLDSNRRHNNHKMDCVMFYDNSKASWCILKNKIIYKLQSTSLESIKAIGISDMATVFVYYDEPHVTGTDIPIYESSKALLTVHPDNTSQDKLLQAVLRERKFFAKQTVDITTFGNHINSEDTDQEKLKCIFNNAIYAQAVQKSRETFQAYNEMINAILREGVMKKLLASSSQNRKNIIDNYKFILQTVEEKDLFKKYAYLGAEEIAVEMLRKKIKDILTSPKYERLLAESRVMREELNALEKSIQENKKLIPEKVMSSGNIGTKVQQNQTQAVKQQQQAKVQNQVLQQLAEQFRSMQGVLDPSRVTETRLQFESKTKEVRNLQITEFGRLHELKNSQGGELLANTKDYIKLFPDNFYLSKNYYKVFKEGNSLFNKNLLRKVNSFVLLLKDKDGKFKTVMISQQEAHNLLKILKTSEDGEIKIDSATYRGYLYTINGDRILKNDHQYLADGDRAKVSQCIFYANLFTGNTNNFGLNRNMLSILATLYPVELKNYLLLRNATFSNSYCEMLVESLDDIAKILTQGFIENLTPRTNAAHEYLIRKLEKKQLVWLQTDEQINSVQEIQVQHLSDEQVAKLTSTELLNTLSEVQVLYVQNSEIKKLNKKKLIVTVIEHNNYDRAQYLSEAGFNLLPDEIKQEILSYGKAPVVALENLSDTLVSYVHDNQIEYLSTAQIDEINKIDSSRFNRLLLSGKLPMSYMKTIVDKSKLELIIRNQAEEKLHCKQQIETIFSDEEIVEFVKHELLSKQIHNIEKTSLIQELVNQGLENKLSNDQIDKISLEDRVKFVLDRKLTKYLSQVTDRDLIKQILMKREGLLDDSKINLLSDDTILELLNENKLVTYIKNTRFQGHIQAVINANKCDFLSAQQLKLFLTKQIVKKYITGLHTTTNANRIVELIKGNVEGDEITAQLQALAPEKIKECQTQQIVKKYITGLHITNDADRVVKLINGNVEGEEIKQKLKDLLPANIKRCENQQIVKDYIEGLDAAGEGADRVLSLVNANCNGAEIKQKLKDLLPANIKQCETKQIVKTYITGLDADGEGAERVLSLVNADCEGEEIKQKLKDLLPANIKQCETKQIVKDYIEGLKAAGADADRVVNLVNAGCNGEAIIAKLDILKPDAVSKCIDSMVMKAYLLESATSARILFLITGDVAITLDNVLNKLSTEDLYSVLTKTCIKEYIERCLYELEPNVEKVTSLIQGQCVNREQQDTIINKVLLKSLLKDNVVNEISGDQANLFTVDHWNELCKAGKDHNQIHKVTDDNIIKQLYNRDPGLLHKFSPAQQTMIEESMKKDKRIGNFMALFGLKPEWNDINVQERGVKALVKKSYVKFAIKILLSLAPAVAIGIITMNPLLIGLFTLLVPFTMLCTMGTVKLAELSQFKEGDSWLGLKSLKTVGKFFILISYLVTAVLCAITSIFTTDNPMSHLQELDSILGDRTLKIMRRGAEVIKWAVQITLLLGCISAIVITTAGGGFPLLIAIESAMNLPVLGTIVANVMAPLVLNSAVLISTINLISWVFISYYGVIVCLSFARFCYRKFYEREYIWNNIKSIWSRPEEVVHPGLEFDNRAEILTELKKLWQFKLYAQAKNVLISSCITKVIEQGKTIDEGVLECNSILEKLKRESVVLDSTMNHRQFLGELKRKYAEKVSKDNNRVFGAIREFIGN